jgi:dienelactone hydrolase
MPVKVPVSHLGPYGDRMTDVIAFHHAMGQTPGFLAFVNRLGSLGYVVHAPDVFLGEVFDDVDEGVAFAESLGAAELIRRAEAALEDVPTDAAYLGMSMGTGLASHFIRTRPGAQGAVLLYGQGNPADFDGPWSLDLPVQIHTMEEDKWVDVAEARRFVSAVPTARLYLYPGSGHLFAEEGDPDYDDPSAVLLWERMTELLARI